MSNPAIVVIAFNRPHSLERLLGSIARSRFPLNTNVDLVISVDFSSSHDRFRCVEIATEFEWNNGSKRVIAHESNLGLRRHVLACGDLTAQYEEIIILEDDLTVGPEFYIYASKALLHAGLDPRIAGVSLYDHRTNFANRLAFCPLFDGYDNYYLQVVSSWGQAWNRKQWSRFRFWYDERSARPIPHTAPILDTVIRWPESSWAKYFNWYLAEEDRFFMYPRHAHTTNNSELGTHISTASLVWQVPLAIRCGESRFSSVDESLAVYDSHFEALPSRVKVLAPVLEPYDFDVDLYGEKRPDVFSREFVLTSKHTSVPAKLVFDLRYKPMELNLTSPKRRSDEIAVFSLAKCDTVKSSSALNLKSVSVLQYFFGAVPLKTILRNSFSYFRQRRS